MRRFQGIGIILFFIIAYMIVGTPEYDLELKEASTEIQINDYDYIVEIEQIQEQLQKINAEMETLNSDLEDLQMDLMMQ